MSKFTNALIVSPLPDGKRWVLISDFSYDADHEGSGRTISVNKGFITDFASVPRVLWWVFPKWGKYGNAAVIHDWLYWQQMMTRRTSDDIFLEAMGVLNTPKVKRWALYRAVRVFGWIAWRKNEKLKASGKTKILEYTTISITLGNL